MLVESPQTLSSQVQAAALELVWPTRCAGCEKPGCLLCPECISSLDYTEAEYACPWCGAPYGWLVCTECYSAAGRLVHNFSLAVSTLTLDELAGGIVVIYKDNNERGLAPVLAELLLQSIPSSWQKWAEAITWIPSDSRTLRRRGFEHMEPIANAVGQALDLPVLRILHKRRSRDQRRLNRQERISNLREGFSLLNPQQTLPARLLLLDDVFTTGASLDAAAQLLRENGAEEVRTACLARVW